VKGKAVRGFQASIHRGKDAAPTDTDKDAETGAGGCSFSRTADKWIYLHNILA